MKIKDLLEYLLVTIAVAAMIGGIAWFKYIRWRAEHPDADLWTFFF